MYLSTLTLNKLKKFSTKYNYLNNSRTEAEYLVPYTNFTGMAKRKSRSRSKEIEDKVNEVIREKEIRYNLNTITIAGNNGFSENSNKNLKQMRPNAKFCEDFTSKPKNLISIYFNLFLRSKISNFG